eukprot:1153173-Pelagomonas_calceolata.AAC.2
MACLCGMDFVTCQPMSSFHTTCTAPAAPVLDAYPDTDVYIDFACRFKATFCKFVATLDETTQDAYSKLSVRT